jgi:putative transposase
MFPTKKQKEELRKWFGTARYCYNQVIAMYKKDKKLPLDNKTRNKILKSIPFKHSNVNLEVKRNAIEEAFNTISAGGNFFKFRSRKSKQESVYVRRGCVSIEKNTIFSRTFKTMSWKKKTIPKPTLDGSKLVRKGNKYYLYVVKVKEPPSLHFKEGTKQSTICALDPGTHTFLDYYSTLECGKIAPEAGTQVFSHCKRIYRLISKSSTLKSRYKYKLKRAIAREREKLKNKIDDLHWKTASFLCNRYDHVFLPHFETQEMSKKHKRKIRSKTARKMLTLSHFLFSQRLVSKAEETGTCIYKLHEPYTSQLCGNCFCLNTGLKLNQRTYKCKHCKTEIDRDFNGARNILLRGLWLLNEQGTSSLRWEVAPFHV